MKKLFLLAFLFIGLNAIQAQTVYNLDTPKTEQQLVESSTKTEDTAIWKGVTYPVYVSNNNKHFIVVKAKKSGNLYRKYLKV